jgi:ankyrin repeat protein
MENPVQNVEIVKELIFRKTDINAVSLSGMTPLLLAAEKGYSLLLLTLLENGADVNF